MKLIEFACTICFETRRERAPRLIDESNICLECIKEDILPFFENALKYEHEYPPRWGPVRLEIADFEDLIRIHLGEDFVDRYQTREVEYSAKERVYCKHQIDSLHAPKCGELCPVDSKLALSPKMIEIYKAAGRTQVECGGFVTEGPELPGSFMICPRCNGKVCAACGTSIHDKADEIHDCNFGHQADEMQDLQTQIRGRDIQQCPNGACSNVVGLQDGCNHLVCNRCYTNFCFICGAEADHNSGHWDNGNPCPRWNQPGARNAIYDGGLRGPDIDWNDAEWGELMSQIRFVVLYRLEDGLPMIDEEWLFQLLRDHLPDEDTGDVELQNLAMRMLPAFQEVQIRPTRIPSSAIPILSPDGLDAVAMRAAESLLDEGAHALSRAWFNQVVRDLELRELPEQEYEDLRASVTSTLLSVTNSWQEDWFEINVNNATPDVARWARLQGFELTDEPVVALLRLYDDCMFNLELAEVVLPDDEEIREFQERHDAIRRVAERFGGDFDVDIFGMLSHKFHEYREKFPEWAEF